MTDLTPNDLSHLSDAEFHALCPQGEHAPGPEPLSPTAQAEPVAEPPAVAEQPSDEEILELMPQQMREDLATAAHAIAKQAGIDSRRAIGAVRIILNRHAVDLSLAVLARWGNHFPDATKMVPPAKGEIAELVKYLRGVKSLHCQRAAELLERHPAPVPVPVAEPPAVAEGEVAKLVAQLHELAEVQDDDGWEGDAVMLRRAAELLKRHAAPEPLPEPVAWMYKDEAYFNGKEWRENWEVTTCKRLAVWKSTPEQPVPLYALPLPALDSATNADD